MFVKAMSATAALAVALGATSAAAAPVPRKYPRCSALNAMYEHGVGKQGARDSTSSGDPVRNFLRAPKIYAANRHLDRDGDGIACEKH